MGGCGREQPSRHVNSCSEFSFSGQIQVVFARQHLVGEVTQSIVGDSRVFLRAVETAATSRI